MHQFRGFLRRQISLRLAVLTYKQLACSVDTADKRSILIDSAFAVYAVGTTAVIGVRAHMDKLTGRKLNDVRTALAAPWLTF